MQEDKGRQSEKQNKRKERKKEKSEVGGKQEKEVANMISRQDSNRCHGQSSMLIALSERG